MHHSQSESVTVGLAPPRLAFVGSDLRYHPALARYRGAGPVFDTGMQCRVASYHTMFVALQVGRDREGLRMVLYSAVVGEIIKQTDIVLQVELRDTGSLVVVVAIRRVKMGLGYH